MADIYSNLPPELVLQQQQLNRQQEMAKALLAQGAQQQQSPAGQMVSGRYVPNSFFQNLQGPVNQVLGAYMAQKGDTEAAKLAEKLRTGRLEGQKAIMEKINAGDTKGALALATQDQYGAGKELIPALVGNVIPKTPEKVAEYNFAVQNGFKGSYNDFANQMTPYQNAQLGLERQKLNLEMAKLQNELGGGKLTESQGNATGFGLRAKEANAIIDKLEKGGTTDTGLIRATAAGAVGGTPFIGEHLANTANTLLNWTASPEQQQTKQARQNFITAVLRKESGATIKPEEFQVEEEKYFPKINDSATVIEQKRQARELAIKALEMQAGPGAKLINEFKPKTDFGSGQKVVNFNDLK